MEYDTRYYQKLIYNLSNILEFTADDVMIRGDKEEMEDFIDMLSNIIIEYANITPEMKQYLSERGYEEDE